MLTPRISDKDNLVSRYSYSNNKENDPAAYPGLGSYPLTSRSQNVGLSHVHIFTPNITSEIAYNYYRTFFYFLNASEFNGKDVVGLAGIRGFEAFRICNRQLRKSTLQVFAPLKAVRTIVLKRTGFEPISIGLPCRGTADLTT
ncbi:MAG: hypothetical protein WKF37_18485 [Bryobacteraceae bacterium]